MAGSSEWWYQQTAVTDIAAPVDSHWRSLPAKLREPHFPIGVFVGGEVVYVPIHTWDGTTLR